MKEKSLLELTQYMTLEKVTENLDELNSLLKKYPKYDWEIWRLGIALDMGYILGIRAERANRAGNG